MIRRGQILRANESVREGSIYFSSVTFTIYFYRPPTQPLIDHLIVRLPLNLSLMNHLMFFHKFNGLE